MSYKKCNLPSLYTNAIHGVDEGDISNVYPSDRFCVSLLAKASDASEMQEDADQDKYASTARSVMSVHRFLRQN